MFDCLKTKSQRILFCEDFLSFFRQNYNSHFLYLNKKYQSEEIEFGTEFYNVNEKDEEWMGSLLLEFLSTKKSFNNL